MAPGYWLLSRRSATVLALAALAAGCQDYATAPVLPGAATRGSAAEAVSPFTCFTSIATPGGPSRYRHGRLQLTFPKEALAPDGSTMSYRYRGYASGAELDRLADCTIPRSAAAVEMMHRRFGVHDKKATTAGETSDGGLTILGTDIDGIVITACQYGGEYPNCNPKPIGYQEDPNPPAVECSTYCDPWSNDGGGGGGGTTDETAMSYGDDEAWDCSMDPVCGPQLKLADGAQMQALNTAINQIKADKHDVCRRIQENARQMAARPVYVWEDVFKDDVGKIVLADTYAVTDGNGGVIGAGFRLWTQSIDAPTIAHEAMHGYWTAENNYLGWKHNVLYEGRTMNGSAGWETFCTT